MKNRLRIVLADLDLRMCEAWRGELQALQRAVNCRLTVSQRPVDIEVHHGPLDKIDIGELSGTSAIVSPGNAIGFLGGGFDLALARLFDPADWVRFEKLFQSRLFRATKGYSAGTQVVELGLKSGNAWDRLRCDTIIHVPTMKVPHKIDAHRANEVVFDAVWSLLVSFVDHQQRGGDAIDAIVVPGLGTGYGGVPARVCARAMCYALYIFGIDSVDHLERARICLRYLGEQDSLLFKNATTMPAFDHRVDQPEKLFGEPRNAGSGATSTSGP